jgi:uncharacterized membrane protein
MNFIKEYLEYAKDNPEKYWFKAKWYGWGWTPVTWQGWGIILVYLIAIILLGLRIEKMAIPEEEVLQSFVLPVIAMTALLIAICFKTGEPPRWNWGKPKK